jgi:hypothetical protein
MFKGTENSMSSGTALITGASSGIGAIYADGLRRQLQPNRTLRVPRQVPPSRYFGIVNGQRRNRG